MDITTCAHIIIYICTCTYVYMCICVYVYVYMYICVYVYMFICIYVHMYTCTHVHMYICIYVYMCICVYVHMYICIYVYMYMYLYISFTKPLFLDDQCWWYQNGARNGAGQNLYPPSLRRWEKRGIPRCTGLVVPIVCLLQGYSSHKAFCDMFIAGVIVAFSSYLLNGSFLAS